MAATTIHTLWNKWITAIPLIGNNIYNCTFVKLQKLLMSFAIKFVELIKLSEILF